MENSPSPDLLRLGGGKGRQGRCPLLSLLKDVLERQEGCLGPGDGKPSSLLARKIQSNAAFGGLLVAVMACLTHFLIILAVGTETTNDGWN